VLHLKKKVIHIYIVKVCRGGECVVPLILDFSSGRRLGGSLEPLCSCWRRNKFLPLPVFKYWIVLPITCLCCPGCYVLHVLLKTFQVLLWVMNV